jgi:hypothetical protein
MSLRIGHLLAQIIAKIRMRPEMLLIFTLVLVIEVPTASEASTVALSLALHGGNNLSLSWPISYPAFGLEYTTNLSFPDWIPLTNASTANGFSTVDDSVTNQCRFH